MWTKNASCDKHATQAMDLKPDAWFHALSHYMKVWHLNPYTTMSYNNMLFISRELWWSLIGNNTDTADESPPPSFSSMPTGTLKLQTTNRSWILFTSRFTQCLMDGYYDTLVISFVVNMLHRTNSTALISLKQWLRCSWTAINSYTKQRTQSTPRHKNASR